MSNVIRFLEAMGTRQLSAADYAASVAALDVDSSHRAALLGRDQAALNDMLGGRKEMYCMVVVAEEEV